MTPIFRPLFDGLAAAHGFETVLGAAMVALAMGALGFVAIRLALAFARASSPRPAPGDGWEMLERGRDAAAWRDLARAAATRGDFARAIAALWMAALVRFDETAIVAFDEARTPGDYRRLVRRSLAAAGAPFDALARRYVLAKYARTDSGPDDFATAEHDLDAIEAALGTRAPA